MRCFQCGSGMRNTVTDLPFKVQQKPIIIIKNLPVWQCENCNEYLLEDDVMKALDVLIESVDRRVEVEILSYAA